jgi:dihydroxyacetone kinase DhaKLM complex PTS-EIIA-like component DhaM
VSQKLGHVLLPCCWKIKILAIDLTEQQRTQFEALCAAVVGGDYTSVYSPDDNAKVRKAIDNLIAFVEEINN